MAIIGLLLFLISATVAGGVLVAGRNFAANGHLFGYTFNGLTESGLFASGLVVGVLAVLSISIFLSGLASSNKRRARHRIAERRLKNEHKELGRLAQSQAERANALVQERDDLAAELERERRAQVDAGPRGG